MRRNAVGFFPSTRCRQEVCRFAKRGSDLSEQAGTDEAHEVKLSIFWLIVAHL